MYAKHSSNSICMFRAISLSIFLFESFIVAAEFAGGSANAQQSQGARELAPVHIEGQPYGEELVGPYNQPRWSARGRFSADTDVYVLPPYSFYLDLDYHGTFPRRGFPDHLFIQEFELGLPYRFQLAFELYEEAQNGRGQVPFTLVEGRYALADWGKIPLNPTILGEYSFGIGKRYPVQPGENQESEAGNDQSDVAGRVKRVTKTNIPDAYELRLLLGTTSDSPHLELFAIFSVDFGTGAEREPEGPVAGGGRFR